MFSRAIADTRYQGPFHLSFLTIALAAFSRSSTGIRSSLVEYQPALALEQFRIEPLQLVLDHADLLDRIGLAVHRRDIDHVQQQARARDMLEELHAESGAFGRAFDQARDVGDHETLVGLDAHDAEMRLQGRERIVGDFRRRGRNGPDKGRLAGIRKAEHADVGQHLELQAQLALLARRALAWPCAASDWSSS